MRHLHLIIFLLFYSLVFSQEKLRVEYEVTPKFQTVPNDNFKISAVVSNFELLIDNNESFYNHIPKISNEQVEGNMFNISASFSADANPIYIDTQSEIFIEQAEIANQAYLIKDDLPNINWKISKETKEIAGFPVQKAVAFLNDEFNTKILAWYSPKLTYKTGPEKFWGLPGLILSLETSITHSDGTQEGMEYVATKVETTSKPIKIPTKGKKVSLEEFNTIRADFLSKQRQMMGLE